MQTSIWFPTLCAFVFSIFSSAAEARITEQKIKVGPYASRAIVHAPSNSGLKPVLILIPGSGSNGPEEMVEGKLTVDGRDHSLFAQMSAPFEDAGIITIALGKPGVEFFTSWEDRAWYYDRALFARMAWKDLVQNVQSAITYALSRSDVDPTRIYLLGHSEGTDVAADVANVDSRIKGILLLGYVGSDMATTAGWQLFEREIELFAARDVDANRDGWISRIEASKWSEFSWDWKPGQDRVSLAQIRQNMRMDQTRQGIFKSIERSPLYEGVFRRGPQYEKAASLKQDVFVFTGALDVQTPPNEAFQLKKQCQLKKKANCLVAIVPGLGHGFSPPRQPRGHLLLDMTLGPVQPSFQKQLHRFAKDQLLSNRH